MVLDHEPRKEASEEVLASWNWIDQAEAVPAWVASCNRACLPFSFETKKLLVVAQL